LVSKQLYRPHPEAFNDIDEIRAYIAEENPDAADCVVAVFHGRRSPRVIAAILRGRE
jgi:phage gp45-like